MAGGVNNGGHVVQVEIVLLDAVTTKDAVSSCIASTPSKEAPDVVQTNTVQGLQELASQGGDTVATGFS